MERLIQAWRRFSMHPAVRPLNDQMVLETSTYRERPIAGTSPGAPIMTTSAWLLEHQSNTYSQTGEDGIIAAILGRLPATDGWCVEVGAWDGRHLSNSRRLIEDAGYAAVMIEGSAERFAELRANYAAYPKVYPINQFVGFHPDNNLDHLLSTTPIPVDFDFLSVDIDGNDYHVWQAMSTYRPKSVCIEFNPTIPTDVDFIQPADPAVNQGSSVSAMAALGKVKGYELVCVLPHNAFFVRAEYLTLFDIPDNSVASLRQDRRYLTYLFQGYDGTIFLRGNRSMVWHGRSLRESKVQAFPRLLRKFPANYSKFEWLVFRVLARLGRI